MSKITYFLKLVVPGCNYHLLTATMGTMGHTSGMVTVEGTMGASPLTGD